MDPWRRMRAESIHNQGCLGWHHCVAVTLVVTRPPLFLEVHLHLSSFNRHLYTCIALHFWPSCRMPSLFAQGWKRHTRFKPADIRHVWDYVDLCECQGHINAYYMQIKHRTVRANAYIDVHDGRYAQISISKCKQYLKEMDPVHLDLTHLIMPHNVWCTFKTEWKKSIPNAHRSHSVMSVVIVIL